VAGGVARIQLQKKFFHFFLKFIGAYSSFLLLRELRVVEGPQLHRAKKCASGSLGIERYRLLRIFSSAKIRTDIPGAAKHARGEKGELAASREKTAETIFAKKAVVRVGR